MGRRKAENVTFREGLSSTFYRAGDSQNRTSDKRE